MTPNLASDDELRTLVPKDLELILRLEEWNYPDLVEPEQKVSNSRAFQQIAAVIESGDVFIYEPSQESNTHWSNWPDGGQL